nr:high affinity cationic amino acid transporter 1-like [Leptinotarsa decemlineata]
MIAFLVIMTRQPTADLDITFKVPLIPYIPCLSVIFNLYLMLELDLHTWIRFLVWLFLGLMIYFFYGISHSSENLSRIITKKPVSGSEKEVTEF